jgi:hypothetical protein
MSKFFENFNIKNTNEDGVKEVEKEALKRARENPLTDNQMSELNISDEIIKEVKKEIREDEKFIFSDTDSEYDENLKLYELEQKREELKLHKEAKEDIIKYN